MITWSATGPDACCRPSVPDWNPLWLLPDHSRLRSDSPIGPHRWDPSMTRCETPASSIFYARGLSRATKKQKILDKVILGPVARHLVGPAAAVPCCPRTSRGRTCGIIGSTPVIRALSCGVGVKRLPAAPDSNKVRSRRSDSRKRDRTVKPSVAGVSHDPTAEDRPSVVLRQVRAMNGPSCV